MSWNNIKLDSALGKTTTAASKTIAELSSELGKLSNIKSIVQEQISKAEAVVAGLKQDLNQLGSSGFYSIMLSADQGRWSSRLMNADRAPENSPASYSAAFIMLGVAPSLSPIQSAVDSVKESLSKPLSIPTVKAPPLSFSMPTEDEMKIFDEDVWNALSLKDILPGSFKTAEAALNAAQATLDQLQNTMKGITEKENVFKGALSSAESVLNKLGNIGAYTLWLPPAKGGWLDRMQNEIDAPPDSEAYYCGGNAVVVIASTFLEVQGLYGKLQDAI